ncbi:MAG: hypothetical protein ABJA34_13990, partial [Pseudonocardiales bacterium]
MSGAEPIVQGGRQQDGLYLKNLGTVYRMGMAITMTDLGDSDALHQMVYRAAHRPRRSSWP